MKTITVSRAGSMDVNNEAARPEATKPGRIRVRVKYAGVGFADVMAVRGGYPLAPRRPFSPGYEFLGHIESDSPLDASSSAERSLVSGARVVGVLPRMGAYREVLDVDPRLVVVVPPGVDDEKAAALPLNYVTAFALVDRCARLHEGGSFVIHGAAGGVGTAALELARVLNLRAFGTASPAKHELVRSLGGVPLNRGGDAWLQELLRLQPRGVDAAFDSFGVASFRNSWRALARKGTLVCYGLAPSIDGGTWDFVKGLLYLGMKKVFSAGKRVRICGTPGIVRTDPEWFRISMANLLEWANLGALQPVVAGVMPWHKVAEAHSTLANRAVTGKLLLDFSR